ncbi:hypothetical protein [Streptomyces griseoaurantiacus]|uniref:hypothetical protein n=1 Tax=Streptomyces griseoaurantiacus TaxID=68213 RepID=UPI00382EC471
MARRDLEVVARADLERLGMVLPAVTEATVGLVRSGGGGKWHVPTEKKQWSEHCQHAARAAGEPKNLVLLDVLDQVCARCAGRLPARLPHAVVALWQACSLTVAADRFAVGLCEDTRARTWLGYAVALDASPRKDDARVRELLRPVLSDDEFGAQAWKAMAGWSQVLERAEEQLAAYREAAPPAVASVTVGAALDAVGRETAVHEQAQVLERAAGGDRRWTEVGVWDCLRLSWAHAREQGRCAVQAQDLARRAVFERWGRQQVVDVSALPCPALTPVGSCSSPAEWAQQEYRHLWAAFVERWCARLEEEFAAQHTGGEDEQLLMVTDWPLTHRGDLAYLSQFRQVGPAVPAGLREEAYGRTRKRHAVVLAVPRYAVEHAVAHEDRPRWGQTTVLTAGDALDTTSPESAQAAESAARVMLRAVYPYLPEDVATDGKRPQASAQVRAARAEQRAARPDIADTHWAQQRERDVRWQWRRAFGDGIWAWVPDDTATGPAAVQMQDLADHHYSSMVVRLDVEAGPRTDNTLVSLYGLLTGWDARRRILNFAPQHGHRPMQVPVHRIVAMTGDRERRGRREAPMWEPYTPPRRW